MEGSTPCLVAESAEAFSKCNGAAALYASVAWQWNQLGRRQGSLDSIGTKCRVV